MKDLVRGVLLTKVQRRKTDVEGIIFVDWLKGQVCVRQIKI